MLRFSHSVTYACLGFLLVEAPVQAQTAPAADTQSGLQEIVVTAQKREQRLQDVGLTVTALGAEQLDRLQVNDINDLASVTPGLNFAPSANDTPVITLRGVGFYEASIQAYPDVSVYLDQAPLPFPVMTALTMFDLERVEVLKGPQGTLFGTNATGGAINFVAAKPTATFQAGGEIGYGSFNTSTVEAYVSGPLSDTLTARLSGKIVSGDGWQQNYSQLYYPYAANGVQFTPHYDVGPVSDPAALGVSPVTTLGKTDTAAVRLLMDWKPSDTLTVALNLNGWHDGSDPQAPQLYSFSPVNPVPPDYLLTNYPIAPQNDRAATWDQYMIPRADNKLTQATLRIDWSFVPTMALTSLSNYIHYSMNQVVEADGTPFSGLDLPQNTGHVNTFSQELRLANTGSETTHWVIGANYERDSTYENDHVAYNASSSALDNGIFTSGYYSDETMNNYAAFANIEQKIIPTVTAKVGARYTKNDRSATNATYDSGDGVTSNFFANVLSPLYQQFVVGVPPQNVVVPNIPIGANFTLNPATGLPELYQGTLDQSNTSWSVGVDWKPTDPVLVYVNVSKGYKAGSIGTISAAVWDAWTPAKQESVLDYEAGVKTDWFDNHLQINAAGFYYDYNDKQVRSKFVDPFFGPLDVLVNVPKSEIYGGEFEVNAAPVRGLTMGLSGTYLRTKVKQYIGTVGAEPNPNAPGLLQPVTQNFAGAPLPFAPEWQISARAEYAFEIGKRWQPFVGADFNYQDSAVSSLQGTAAAQELYKINARGLLNLSAGIQAEDGQWAATLYGRNVTDKYYWTSAIQAYDTNVRYAGRPSEWGITLRYAFK
jgi:outer membrane receptor protein involved in Fe transport